MELGIVILISLHEYHFDLLQVWNFKAVVVITVLNVETIFFSFCKEERRSKLRVAEH